MAEVAKETTPPSAAQQELTALLVYVRQQTEAGVEGGKALVSAQAPLVAKEIIAKEIGLSSLGLVVAVVLAFACLKFSKAAKKSDYGDDGPLFFGAIVTGVAALILGSVNLYSLISVLLAPRLVILDYIRHLL